MNLKDQVFLCLDSACGAGSVAVFVRGECKAYVADTISGTQAKNLIPMVEQALAEANVAYEELDVIASTIGPGSFTGIRIALSAARAFGLALKKPVLGASTLACLAHHYGGSVISLLNAGKGDVFIQSFDAALKALDEVRMVPLSDVQKNQPMIGQLSLIGNAPDTLPNAKMLGELALAHANWLVAPEPLYIRPPDAKLPA